MKKFLMSSSDPKQLSVTVKGLMLAVVPVVMVMFGIPEADLNALVNTIADIVYFGASLVAAVQVAYGMARKVWLGRWTAAK